MVSVQTVALGGIIGAAVLTVLLLSVERPPVNGLVVLAVGPWAVAAGILDTLSATGAYGPEFASVVEFPVGLLVTFVVAGLVWMPLLQLATLRDFDVGTSSYLAAAGLGTAVVLLSTLLVRQGLDGQGLLWLAATPMLTAVLAATAYILVGFIDPSTLATTRWVGYLIVLAFTLLGTTTTVAIDIYGQSTTVLMRGLVTVAGDLPTASVSVGWPAAVLGATVGCLVAALVTRVVRADMVRGNVLAIVVTAVTVGPAVSTLLTTVLR